MAEVKRLHDEKKIKMFRHQIVSFLGDVGPGSKDSLTVEGMPNPIVGCLCKRVVGVFKMAYNLFKHKALWQSEKVFKPVIEAEIVHEDGRPKKFHELGRDLDGNIVCGVCVTVTDLGNTRSMAFVNEVAENERHHFIEAPHRKILNRDAEVSAELPMRASACIPIAFSPAYYPEHDPACLQTPLSDGGAVSNLSAQLLRAKYDKGKAPVRFVISCNEFEYKRDTAYNHGVAPTTPTSSWFEFLNAVFAVIIEDGMADDVDIFLKAKGDMEHIFVTKVGEITKYPTLDSPFLKETPSQINFFALDRHTSTQMFEFGRHLATHKLINKIKPSEVKRAKKNGVTLALSGGGALYPVLFGVVFAMWEHFEVKAIAGTSAGAITASYMAEKIARQED